MENDDPSLREPFWNALYANQETAWDIGHVSTPLKEYFDQLTNKNTSILIPGAGRSYEAVYLAEQGFTDVTVVDISSVLTQHLHEKIGVQYPSIKIITGDFFELNESYDIVIEQTFFCTLHPSLRKKYTQKIQSLLKPGGKLAGVLFNRHFDNSPPFGGSTEEYRQLFSAVLRIRVLESCYNSIPQRAGSEVFLIACK